MVENSPRDIDGPTLPREVMRLLNPAYCALVIAQFTHTYAHGARNGPSSGAPLLLVFLCLPISLHANTRDKVIGHQRGFGLHRFIRTHPETLVGLAERIRAFRSTTQEALLFGVHQGFLHFEEDAAVTADDSVIHRLTPTRLGTDAIRPIRAAERLGHWCAQVSPAEVFLHFGVEP